MLVFALTAHEYAHAATALRQGDDTAYQLGRVTLNPVPHIDPWMSLLLPALLWFGTQGAFTFGGAKPVPVNPRKYRNYRAGRPPGLRGGGRPPISCSRSSSRSFSCCSGSCRSAAPGAAPVLETAQRMMVHGIWLNLILCFFNLIPIPPLDGSHLLYHALPPKAGSWYRGLQRFGYLPLFALMFIFRPVVSVLLTPAAAMMNFLDGVIAPYRVVAPLVGLY